MGMPAPRPAVRPVVYPESDGQPMADNTEQFDFIQVVQGNLDALLPDFVAGDHLWYPVEGRPDIRVAPDVYVALGRPKGPRGSYKQWEEDGIPPAVVFEWWSPNSTFASQVDKLHFYEKYGVREFFTWDQVRESFAAFVRAGDALDPVDPTGGFTSPLLGVRFDVSEDALRMYLPDGRPFRTFRELVETSDRATRERDEATARAAALAERLRALGVDPDSDL